MMEDSVQFHYPDYELIMELDVEKRETERLAAVWRAADREQMIASVERLQEMVQALPVLDPRSPDEILGYDEFGLPR